jgi:hypothetical protein
LSEPGFSGLQDLQDAGSEIIKPNIRNISFSKIIYMLLIEWGLGNYLEYA